MAILLGMSAEKSKIVRFLHVTIVNDNSLERRYIFNVSLTGSD